MPNTPKQPDFHWLVGKTISTAIPYLAKRIPGQETLADILLITFEDGSGIEIVSRIERPQRMCHHSKMAFKYLKTKEDVWLTTAKRAENNFHGI